MQNRRAAGLRRAAQSKGQTRVMKLSVTSWSFPACTLPEAWAVARALGFPRMDLGLLHGPALDRARVLADPEGAAADLAALGLACPSLYWLWGTGLADRAMSEAGALAANLADLEPVLRFARALGVPTLFLLPGVARPGASRARLLADSAAAFRAMVARAAAAGVTLTVEPHVGGLLASPAETLDFLEAAPGLRLTLDHAHFACLGYAQPAIDALIPHAAHVHLRQARPGALQAKWGEGTLDFDRLVEALREQGYAGALSVEYVHQAYMGTLSDDVLTETVRMRDLLRGHGVA
jgi:sugar phosphate isomerase/epimerase